MFLKQEYYFQINIIDPYNVKTGKSYIFITLENKMGIYWLWSKLAGIVRIYDPPLQSSASVKCETNGYTIYRTVWDHESTVWGPLTLALTNSISGEQKNGEQIMVSFVPLSPATILGGGPHPA